jgi:hypothetical protein
MPDVGSQGRETGLPGIVHYFFTPFLIASATFAFAYHFAFLDVDFHHDGILLMPGVDLQQGLMPFRDSYQQYGLGESLLSWLVVSVFGRSILGLRLCTVAFYSATAFFLWIVWQRLLPAWLATVTCLVWLCLSPYAVWTFLPWPSVHALFFQILAIYCLVRFVELGQSRCLILAGLACGMAWMFRWTVGLCLFVAIVLFLILDRMDLKGAEEKTNALGIEKSLLAASVGFTAVLGLSFVFLMLTSAVYDSYLQMMTSHALDFGIAESPLKHLTRILPFFFWSARCPSPAADMPVPGPWAFIPLVCVFMFLLEASKLFGSDFHPSRKDRISLLLAVTGLASLLQYYPVPCIRHLFWAATPVFGLMSYGVWRAFTGARPIVAVVSTLLIGYLFLGGQLLDRVTKAWGRMASASSVDLVAPDFVRGMKVTPHMASELDKLTRKMNELERAYPCKPVVVVHRDAAWNLLPKNAYRFHKVPVYWKTDRIYPDYGEKLNEIIRRHQPILLRGTYGKGGPPDGENWLPEPEGYEEAYRTNFGLPYPHSEVILSLPRQVNEAR